jgi:hypothetical protein
VRFQSVVWVRSESVAWVRFQVNGTGARRAAVGAMMAAFACRDDGDDRRAQGHMPGRRAGPNLPFPPAGERALGSEDLPRFTRFAMGEP